MARSNIFLIIVIAIHFDLISTQSDFGCAGVSYYADVKGLVITCEQNPSIQSKPTACFKDLWWKYLPYSVWGQGLLYDPNPFDLLDLDVCRKKCQCFIEATLNSLNCLPRGRAPTWSRELSETQRSSCYCRGIKLPVDLLDHSDQIVFTLRLFLVDTVSEGVPLLFSDIIDGVETSAKIESFELYFYHIQSAPGPWPPINSVDSLFTPQRLQNIRSFYITMDDTTGKKPQWPNLETALEHINNNVTFYFLTDFNITSVPRPPFARNLRTFLCDRCWSLMEAPTWIKEADKLLLLHISKTPPTFPLSDLPALPSLLHFGFSDCPLQKLPDNFTLVTLYPNLENLDLSYLRLTSMPINIVQGLIRLRHLDLSGNCLTPLPSFKGLSYLKLLNLDGFSIFAGTNFYSDKNCRYGVCTNLKLNQSDLSDLINLEVLSLSYYRNLEISDDAFANLVKLKKLSIDCANLTRLPTSLRYTCNLRTLTAIQNPFDRFLPSDPSTWPIPTFIPKYYKNLTLLNLDYTNLSAVPPSMLMFNVSKGANVLRRLTLSLVNNPLSTDQCQMYKFETRYKIHSSSVNQSGVCPQEYTDTIKIAQESMWNTSDFCPTAASDEKTVSILCMFVLMIILLC